MKTLLKNFRDEYLDRLLELLWDQWTTLGVTGHGRIVENKVIDPEALLIISSTIARYDPRLFDAIVEWLSINGRFINVMRIRRMLGDDRSNSLLPSLLAAAGNSVTEPKWARLKAGAMERKRKPENLFFQKDGNPLPLVGIPDPYFYDFGLLRDTALHRGIAQSFRPEILGNLLLRLRAFLGVSARCEILLFLLINRCGTPNAIARASFYYPATISKAMAEMNQSGFLVSRIDGRHRHYEFQSDAWSDVLISADSSPGWLVWGCLFSAFEKVWSFLESNRTLEKTAREQASSLRRVLFDSVVRQMNCSCVPVFFGNTADYKDENLIPVFISRIRSVFDFLDNR